MSTVMVLDTGESTWELPAVDWAVPPSSHATVLYSFSWCPHADFGLLHGLDATQRGLAVQMPPTFNPKADVLAPKVKSQRPTGVPVSPGEMPSPPSIPRVVMVTDAWDPRDRAGN